MTALDGPSVPDDLWAGMADESGFPLDRDDVYADEIAPHVTSDTPGEMSAQEAIAARYRLPEEFWGSRDLFKRIRQAAWASGNHPDAVLACVLARASGAIGHEVTFDSGRGTPGTLSLFVCLLAKSGIGKSEAYGAATALVDLPSHLRAAGGFHADPEIFRDGLGIGTGEGLAEAFMGSAEVETGKMVIKGRGRGAAPEPEVKTVRLAVRHRAFFFVDEGETLTKLMRERQGSTLGPTLRTAWSGGTLGQANASDDRFRYVPARSYTVGIAIGYQPETAVSMLSDVGPGTPQRFLWFGAQDTEMPAELYEWPDRVTLPPEDAPTGVVHFPREVKQWLRTQHRGKHLGEIEVDPMDSHEPLMRCKLAALLCYLDGRMLVDRSDWVLGGMIWTVSRAIRDRLIRTRDAEDVRRREAEREAHLSLATEIETMKVQVSADVERVARRIAVRVRAAEEAFERCKRSDVRRDFGRDKPLFNAALAHAQRVGWVGAEDDGSTLVEGRSPLS